MKFQHFFKVHQISSNLQNIFESSSETCMWNLSQFREVDLFHRKMLTVQALWNIMKFQHFFKVHQVSSNLQNLLESSKTCMWNLSPFRELIISETCTVPALEISWNFNIFSKFQIFKLENILVIIRNMHVKFEHSESNYFIEKCWQCRPFEISWNFNIFSKFTKFHQTCRIYWNHHQKHACEIWAHSEKLYFSQKNADSADPRNIMKFQHFFQSSPNFIKLAEYIGIKHACEIWAHSEKLYLFHRKMLTVPALWNIMKFQHFFKVHQISSNLQNIFESSSETCMWNLSHSEKLTYFIEKCWQCRPFEISWNFNIFSKFTKFHQTCRTYWNHHQKHACEIWAHSEKLYFFTEKCWQCRPFEISWNFNIFQSSQNFIKLAEHIWIIIRNMHVKFEPIQRSNIFS